MNSHLSLVTNDWVSSISAYCFATLGVLLLSGLAACTQSNKPTLRFHLLHQSVQGNILSDVTKTNELPENIMYIIDNNGGGVFVEMPAIISENCLKDVFVTDHLKKDKSILNYKLTDSCTDKFSTFTGKNIGRQMAVIFDGKLVSTPTINARINSGSGFFEGDFEAIAETEK